MIDTITSSVDNRTKSGIFCRQTSTPTSKEPLVLIMGYAGSSRIWPQSFVDCLARRYLVITYDNRGTGLSCVPKDPSLYTIKGMADDLAEVIALLQLDKFHLLGYSMGGCIALQYAHDHGHKVRSLVLLSSTAGGALYAKPEKALSMQLANPPGKTLWDIYMSTFALMYSPKALQHCEPVLRQIYENSKDSPTSVIGLQGHSHAFRNFDGTSYLPTLSMPVAVIAGRDDRLMPLANSVNIAEAIPGAKLIVVPDCEHGVHVQAEALVIKEITSFCQE